MALTTTQRIDNGAIVWVGQPLVFAFSQDAIVSGVPTQYFNVKFVAEVFIAGNSINVGNTTDLVATVKVVPNNKGVGIFNLRSVVESYVKPQRNGYQDTTAASKYKGVTYNTDPHPIHVIDKWCQNDVSYKEMRVVFSIEAATYVGGPVTSVSSNTFTTSAIYIMNAYVPTETRYARYTGPIRYYNTMQANGGFDYYQYGSNSFVLSNAPTTQYANRYDYGVFSALSSYPSSGMVIVESHIVWTSRAGVVSAPFTTTNNAANGGATPTTETKTQMVFVGAFPANIMEQNTAFKNAIIADNVDYYDIKLRGGSGSTATRTYRIIVNCAKKNDAFTGTLGVNTAGYTPIRLCWLNSLGAWDYYTFTQKSIRKLKTKKVKYQQLEGTWNEDYYQIQGWKGGSKDYRVNTTENVVMNTDFMSEADAEWFEFLMNSNEVYIMEQRDINGNFSNNTNTWMRPVTLKTSSFTRKTRRNDSLIQYTIEVEKSRIQNNQNA